MTRSGSGCFPAAYREDDAAGGEFRELTEAALRTERVGAAGPVLDELERARAMAACSS